MLEQGQIVTEYLYVREVEQIHVELITTWNTRAIDYHDESKGWDCEVMTIRRLTWDSGKQDIKPINHDKFQSTPQEIRGRCLKIHADYIPWMGF